MFGLSLIRIGVERKISKISKNGLMKTLTRNAFDEKESPE
jgi:hypothetical protein